MKDDLETELMYILDAELSPPELLRLKTYINAVKEESRNEGIKTANSGRTMYQMGYEAGQKVLIKEWSEEQEKFLKGFNYKK